MTCSGIFLPLRFPLSTLWLALHRSRSVVQKKKKKWNTAFPRSVKEGGRRQRDKGKTKSTTRGEFLPPAIKYCSPLERQCFASWPAAGVSKWEQGVWQEKTVFFPLGARLLRSPTKLYPPTSLWHLAKSSYVHSLCYIYNIFIYSYVYIYRGVYI